MNTFREVLKYSIFWQKKKANLHPLKASTILWKTKLSIWNEKLDL